MYGSTPPPPGIQRHCKPRCYYLGIETYESREGSSDFLLPTSNFQLPTSDFRLPTSDFQLSTYDFRLQTSDLQTSDFRLDKAFELRISDF